jgi:hypothetical protein
LTVTTNTSFDTYNAASGKWPVYTIEFDGEAVRYCNHRFITSSTVGDFDDAGGEWVDGPGDFDDSGINYKRYLVGIKGLSQTVKPEMGQATISGITISLLDKNADITTLIASDTYNMHRKQVTVRAGYKGMVEDDFIIIAIFWVTGLKKSSDNLCWEFTCTDPQKWLQKTICRDASDAAPVYYAGNAINILLSILTSSDAGTNSDYDLGDDDLGCGLDSDTIDIAAIEAVRDDWFWSSVYFLEFEIKDKFEAKKFIEKEILQLLNCYPAITGAGKYKIIPFKPPIATSADAGDLTESVMVGVPQLDLNFAGVINEIDFSYDYDGSDFDSETYHVDATSYSARGPSAKPLEIESKGLQSTHATSSRALHATELVANRAKSVFARYANPPARLPVTTFFSKWIIEAGDIVGITHSKISDPATGSAGLSSQRAEVVKRSVDWNAGTVKLDLLMTSFGQSTYSAYSPYMTITAASSGTAFTVSVADAARWSVLWGAVVVNENLVPQCNAIIIQSINTDTGAITCDDIGVTPSVGWFVMFADYNYCTAEQKLYAFLSDGSDYLGSANDAAHLISA